MAFKVCFVLIAYLIGLGVTKEIRDVDKDGLQDLLKEKQAVVLYITEEDCVQCRRLYHKFVITSQTFENDDVIFARVNDKQIAERFDVTSLPGIVFYEFGSNIPRAYRGDVTSNELSKLVIKAMRGDFRSLDLKHAVELTKDNYQAIMDVQDQCKYVMLHEEDDEMEVDDFSELAEVYGNDDGVVMATINVNKQKKLKKKFKAVVYPAYYLYPRNKKDKREIESGDTSLDKMVALVNKECGTSRVKDGRLNPLAGLIPEIDRLLDQHGKDLYEVKNLDNLKTKVEKIAKKQQKSKDLAEFYVDLLGTLIEEGTIDSLDKVRDRLHTSMDNAGPLKRDVLYQKKNILEKFIDVIGKHIMSDFTQMHNLMDPNDPAFEFWKPNDEL